MLSAPICLCKKQRKRRGFLTDMTNTTLSVCQSGEYLGADPDCYLEVSASKVANIGMMLKREPVPF